MSKKCLDVETSDYNIIYYGSYTVSKIKSLYTYLLGGNFEAQEIIKNVYLGNIDSAYDYNKLKELGITHIISVIAGFYPSYEDFNYLTLDALDTENTNLKDSFELCNNFIDEALDNNGKVLIHCMAGRSRSATILCAYIIKNFGMDLDNTLKSIKEKRDIIDPNTGFINQLNNYYNSLYNK